MKKTGLLTYTVFFTLCILFTFQNLTKLKPQNTNSFPNFTVVSEQDKYNQIKTLSTNTQTVKAANCINAVWVNEDHRNLNLGNLNFNEFETEIPPNPQGHRSTNDCFEYLLNPRTLDDDDDDSPYNQRTITINFNNQYIEYFRFQMHDYNDTVGLNIQIERPDGTSQPISSDYPRTDIGSDNCGITSYNSLYPWRNGCYLTHQIPIGQVVRAIHITPNAHRDEAMAFRLISIQGDNSPTGYHDAATCDATWGWACDSSDFNNPVEIQIYADGPMGTGSLVASGISANQNRSDIASTCGGNPNHGFVWNIPNSLKTGTSRNLYVYAVNRGPVSKPPTLLNNSPRNITCTAANSQPQCNGFNTYSNTDTTNPLPAIASKTLTDTITVRVATSDPQGLAATQICWTADGMTQGDYRVGSNFICQNVCSSSSNLSSCTYNNNNLEHRGYLTDTVQGFINRITNSTIRSRAQTNGVIFLTNIVEGAVGGGMCSTNPGYSESGSYWSGANVNTNTSCGAAGSGNCTRRIGINIPIDGVCGAAAATYPATANTFSGAFCSSGTANPATPIFPAPGNTSSWTCNGINGGISTSCSAYTSLPIISGACGTAATNYPYTANNFSGTFCSSGTSDPSSPAFPSQGGTSTWNCQGSNNGVNVSCTAVRDMETCTNNPSNPSCNQCLNPANSPISLDGTTCTNPQIPKIKITDNNSIGNGAQGIDVTVPLKLDWTDTVPANNGICTIVYALELRKLPDLLWTEIATNLNDSETTLSVGSLELGSEYRWRVRALVSGTTAYTSEEYSFTTNYQPEYLQSGAAYVANDVAETPKININQIIGQNPVLGQTNGNLCSGNSLCNIGPVTGSNKFGGSDNCFTGSVNSQVDPSYGEADNPILFWFDYQDRDNYQNTNCAGNEFSKHKLALVPKGSYNVDTVDDNLDVINRASLFIEYNLTNNSIVSQKGEVIVTPIVNFDAQNKLRIAYKLKFRDEFPFGAYDIFALVNSTVNDPRQDVGGTLLYDTHVLPSTGKYRKVGEWTIDTTPPDVQEPVYSDLGYDTFNVKWNIRTDLKLFDLNLSCYSADQTTLDKNKASVLGYYNPVNYNAEHIYPFPGDFTENGQNKCSSDTALSSYKTNINNNLNALVNLRTRHKVSQSTIIDQFRARSRAVDFACNQAISPIAQTDNPTTSLWISTYGGTVMSSSINSIPQTTLDSVNHELYCNYEGQYSTNNDILYSNVNTSLLNLSTGAVFSTDNNINNSIENSLVGAKTVSYIDSLDSTLQKSNTLYYDLVKARLTKLDLITTTINGDRTISKVSELVLCPSSSCYVEINGDLTINGSDGYNLGVNSCDGRTMLLVNGNIIINDNLIKSSADMCCAFIVKGNISFGKLDPNAKPKDELRYNAASQIDKDNWITTSQYDCSTGFYFSENGNITIQQDTSNYGITNSGENFSDAFGLYGHLIAQKGDIIQQRSNGLRNNLQPPVYIEHDSCIYKNFKAASDVFLSTRDINF
jgi:hypothetical protein